MCFRDKSDSFRVPPFCPKDYVNEKNTFFVKNECGAVDLKIASDKCISQSITTAKVIRLRSLEVLKKNFVDMQDFHVIYLVRDPRGVTSSRVSLKGWRWDFVNICRRYRANFEYHNSEASDWLKNKISVVRYEDFSLNTDEYIDMLFDKIGVGYGIEELKMEIRKMSEPDQMLEQRDA